MTRNELKEKLFHLLKNDLEAPGLHRFSEEARLNEDLCLDSVMLLQLIVQIELELGVEIPDELLIPKDFQTVGTLLDFIENLQAEVEES
ncbi:petrobactin biosynthesis protein AsbD [Jeotgalibacillus proteolyticus]|uniref:petrobactin biosynthesis protein AsbD n=1 Tax=Jeotgalibacillus proteolyticus TaxID=2082395 RepID=UPI003CF67DE4